MYLKTMSKDETKNIGRAICPQCDKEIDLAMMGGNEDMSSWDGASDSATCEHCGLEVTVSASVEFTVTTINL